MKTYVVAGVLVILAVAGIVGIEKAEPGDSLYSVRSWFSKDVVYVGEVDGEVKTLEADIRETDRLITAGTLDGDAALALKERIVTRLTKIQETVRKAETDPLTSPKALQTLRESLGKLGGMLKEYQASLSVLDEKAKTSKRSGSRSSGSSSAEGLLPIESIIIDTIEVIEGHVEDITGEEEVNELVDEIVEEIEGSEEEVVSETGDTPESEESETEQTGETPDDSTAEGEENVMAPNEEPVVE